MVYATPIDLGGGSINSSGIVSWPPMDILPHTTVPEYITVQVKNPIPQTPNDPGDLGKNNLVMTNTFGDTINIKVPGSPLKTAETVANTLPNTGPGTGLVIAAVIVVFAGYFFARTRLLATEAGLALHETTGVGGSL